MTIQLNNEQNEAATTLDRPVLVTGATGLLGSWLVKRLDASGADIVCLVRDWVPQSEAVRSGALDHVKVVRGDVCEAEIVERTLAEYEIDTVFHLAAQTIVGVANPGFVGPSSQGAKDLWWGQWRTMWEFLGQARGVGAPQRGSYDRDAGPGGSLFVGAPEEIAERVVDLHGQLGHNRQILQMDVGHLPHREFLRSIELLGTRVKPLVDSELGASRAATPGARQGWQASP